MQIPSFDVAVLMHRRTIDNRWQSEIWEPVAVLCEDRYESEATLVAECDGVQRWLFPALPVTLRLEEAEGYYLNISAPEPKVFVLWQFDNERAVPQKVSASYNDACSWMDAGEQVDSVAMPPQLFDVVSEFAREHYRPQPKKRIRPRSFESRASGPRSRNP